jgi:hypothetical protein
MKEMWFEEKGDGFVCAYLLHSLTRSDIAQACGSFVQFVLIAAASTLFYGVRTPQSLCCDAQPFFYPG